MRYDIWELCEGDIRQLKALNAVFGAAFAQPGVYGADPPSDAYLESLLLDAGFIAIVARHAGEVVGGLTAYVLRKPERERKEIYIYDLAVMEPHRRRGVATALINRLREVAEGHGAHVIFVQTDRDDPPAIALYEKLGTGADVLHFDIGLDWRPAS